MSKVVKTSLLGLTVIVALQAGQIQIGGTSGLTNSYMNTSSTSACSGASNAASVGAVGYNGCLPTTQVTASANALERSYVAQLFQNASGATAPTGTTITDTTNGNVTFNRIQGDVGTGTNPADYWSTGTTTTSSLVIPVGIYGVSKVWTLLNDYWGGTGVTGNIQVAFTWDDSSNGLNIGGTAAHTDTISLKNGETIRSAVACTATPTPAVCKTNNGGMNIFTTLDSMVNHGGVTANNVWSDTSLNQLTTAGSVGNRYAGTGVTPQPLNFYLDDQMFDFGSTHLTEFLVSITISDIVSTTSYTGATVSTNNSRVALSAITVEQTLPEPSTYLMLISGLGAIGYFRRRKA